MKFLHHIILPRFIIIDGRIIGIAMVRSCNKGRLGYTCHGNPGECE